MDIRFVDSQQLSIIKSNLKNFVPLFAKGSSAELVQKLPKDPFVKSKFASIPDITLDMSLDPKDAHLTDGVNAEIIYSSLHFLSDSQASDERLWAGLCLDAFWPYVQYRWKISSDCTESNIKDHFFFGYGSRRSLTRNALARLWWIGRLTYDESNSSDHFHLTKFVCEGQNYITDILERNTSNNPMIVRAFVQAAIDARNNAQIEMTKKTISDASKYLNLLGGAYILDCLPERVLFDKMYHHFIQQKATA